MMRAPLAATALLLAGWQMLAFALSGQYLIASPIEVAQWLAANAGLTGRALAVTGANAALGFVAGNLAAVFLAALALIWPRLLPVISALALVVFCLPIIATGPILRVLMGPGNGPQITLAALAVYYTTLIPLLAGLRAAPAVWFDLIRSYGRGRAAQLIHIRARAGLPYLFAGLQISAPAAFLGAMIGEFTGAERGMGVLGIRFSRALDMPAIWSLALVAAAVAIAVYAAIGLIARALLDEAPPLILAPPAAAPGRSMWPGLLIAIAVTLLIWWGVMEALHLNRFFAKRPLDVLAALVWAPDAGATRATLATALAQTAAYALPGYLAGLGLGVGVAILLALVPAISALTLPLAVALRAIPIVTTAPLIVLLLGRGALGTITLIAVMVFFPSLVACAQGLRQTPGQIIDVLDSYGAGRARQMIHIRIPAMLPALFASARMAVPASVLAVTVVEWLATGRGLGNLMALSASVSDYDMLWSAVVVITALSACAYAAITLIERRALSIFAPEQVRI